MIEAFTSERTAPTLHTARLTLRAHTLADFEASAAMWSHPEVVRFIGGRQFGRDEVWARILRYMGHWSALGCGYWCIEEKATGAFVGEAGFALAMRDLGEPFDSTPEAGWAVAAHAHGKGYASEMVAAILAWADAHFADPRTVCIISPDHSASIRVAEKCGYAVYQQTQYRDAPLLLLERFAPGLVAAAGGRG